MKLPQKLEASAKLFLESKGVTNVALGRTAAERSGTKGVICYAKQGKEEPLGTGNFEMTLVVIVRAACVKDNDGDTDDTDLAALTKQVFDAFSQDDLADVMSANTSAFTVFDVIDRTIDSGQTDDGAWTESMTLRLYCCASDIG